MARLGDYIKQVRGVSYKPEDVCDSSTIDSVPILRANNIQDNGLNFHDLVYVKKARVSKEQMIKAGDIVICTSSGSKNLVGKAAVAKEDLQISFGAFCKVVRTSRMSAEYLGYFFQSPAYRSRIAEVAGGANINNIRNEHIDDLSFPLINQEKQNEAIAVLDKVTDLISLRKQQIAKLDELVKSQFIEMFGAPGNDDKGWGLTTLGACCELNPKKPKEIAEDLSCSFVAMPSVSESGKIDSSIIRPYAEVRQGFTYFSERDVLFAKITPCMENGKGAVAIGLENKIGFGSTEFHVLRPLEGKSNPYWLYYITMFPQFRKNARKVMTGTGGQLRVPISYLADYPISLPPINLQEQFSAFVQQVDKSKFEIQKILEKLETLKKALMQQYFG